MGRIVTLTTDFGLADEYVGIMKGVILGRTPDASIIDLCHSIERHNIQQAALLISSAYRFFPKGTVHLVVVDPGVGSDRKIILLLAGGHLFLAPDNGVLSLVADQNFEAAFEVQCEQFYLTPVSKTFHGRDILAPVAARLAAGLEPQEVGPAVMRQAVETIEIGQALLEKDQGRITGEIVAVDSFGNLQTNITEKSLQKLLANSAMRVAVTIKSKIILGIKDAYNRIPPGNLLAIIGSRGFLEIAVNQGSAASLLDAGVGDYVTVETIKL